MSYALRVLFWELTTQCNLHCTHCRANAQQNADPDEMSTGKILRTARDISDYADPILILTGGEPLMHPDFFHIASTCTEFFSHVALATNGTLIDDRMARRIVETNIQRVSISLDGARASTHDTFRGVRGSFGAALRGFAALKDAGIKLQVNVTVTRHNVDEMEKLLQLAQDCGADAFHVFMLVPVGCGAQITNEQRLTPERGEALLRWLCQRSLDLHGRMFIKATCAPQYLRIQREEADKLHLHLTEDERETLRSTRGCLAGSGVCFISHTGQVQPCGYLPVSAGNIHQQSFIDIWERSPLFTEIRDSSRIKGKCGQCEYTALCQGCRARAYAASGDYLAEEPDCVYQPMHKTEEANA
ncbi:MAG TPA: radical SAM protein [Armatimonadota bacterium]|nr:radical SAM protein [Armatimonadota bacterium]